MLWEFVAEELFQIRKVLHGNTGQLITGHGIDSSGNDSGILNHLAKLSLFIPGQRCSYELIKCASDKEKNDKIKIVIKITEFIRRAYDKEFLSMGFYSFR